MSEDGNKNAHAGHRERLRKLARQNGMASLHPHQALELLLFTPIKRRDTNELAHEIIDHCGGFAEVFYSDTKTLTEVKGVGDSAAAFLQLVGSLYAKYGGYRTDGGIYLNSTLVLDAFLSKCFKPDSGEQLSVSIVDDRLKLVDNRVIRCSDSIKADSELLREVLLYGYDRSVHSCILAHFVPDGDITEAHKKLAKALTDGLSPLLDVRQFIFVRRDGIKAMYINE